MLSLTVLDINLIKLKLLQRTKAAYKYSSSVLQNSMQMPFHSFDSVGLIRIRVVIRRSPSTRGQHMGIYYNLSPRFIDDVYWSGLKTYLGSLKNSDARTASASCVIGFDSILHSTKSGSSETYKEFTWNALAKSVETLWRLFDDMRISLFLSRNNWTSEREKKQFGADLIWRLFFTIGNLSVCRRLARRFYERIVNQ